MKCLQRRRANNHRLIIWRVIELYGARWRRRRRAKIVSAGGHDRLEIQ